jgi:sensor histidine kinase regulating citrate/malate metabolism
MKHRIKLLFLIFCIITFAIGFVAYKIAANELKTQLVRKCEALAATVAAVIEEDSDGYSEFLKTLDTESEYYKHAKDLMMKFRRVNSEHITYLYTEARVNDSTKMYIINGEMPSSPMYARPGTRETMTGAEKIAYSEKKAALGTEFEGTKYGIRLSAYKPITHKENGSFLGLVGVDIVLEQYSSIMRMLIIQIVIIIVVGLTIFALCLQWFSGKFHSLISKYQYEAEFANSVVSDGQKYHQKMKELYETLNILRHDYKYHIKTIGELINSGDSKAVKQYLTDIEEEIPQNELKQYCSNLVINALLSSYAERCAHNNINYNVKLNLPETLAISNYELSIILGNLLENAIEASQKLDRGAEIELEVRTEYSQIYITVKNIFDGIVNLLKGKLSTTKKGKENGFGLRSVETVAARYDGSVRTFWEGDLFTVDVRIRNL